MDKTTIREYFEAYAVDMGGELNGGSWDISGDQLDLACEAIAQAAEEEMAKMEHRYQQANQMDRDIAGMARLDMEKAQAQMAVMGEALHTEEANIRCQQRQCPTCGRYVYRDGHNIDCEVAQALSAAPKVAWIGKAVVLQDDLITVEGGAAKYLREHRILDAIILDDVLVLALEQGQESEQEG
jgi:hypothetical protein